MPFERGFTLLEILAALAIAVIGIMAVAKTTHSAVDLLQSTENRVLVYDTLMTSSIGFGPC